MASSTAIPSRIESFKQWWSAERPPGPVGHPVLGIMPTFRKDPLGSLEAFQGAWGDLATVRIGPIHMWLVTHPELIEEVLVKQQGKFRKDPVTRGLSLMLGDGLLTSEGEHWRRQRRRVAPSLKRAHIQSYAATMVRCAQDELAKLPATSVRNVHEDMMAVTLEIVAETLFGATIDPVAGRRVGEVLEFVMEAFIHEARSWRRFLPGWVPTPARWEVKRAVADIDRLLYQIIAEARASDDRGDHLLARLLDAKDEDGQTMSDAQLRDEAVTVFVAGHETTALTLSYALWAIAHDPAIGARVRQEVDEVLGGRVASAEDVGRLPYTSAIISESLRCYPPAWAIGRQAMEEVQLGRYRLPPGDQVMISPWLSHHDARWFDDPWTFRPERWLDGLAERLPRFAWFPFGGGARICVGNHFALMEATLVLATWMQQVEVTAVPGVELELSPAVTLRPVHGVRVLVRRR